MPSEQLPLNETRPGGVYLVAGRWVNANGEPVDPPEPPKPEPPPSQDRKSSSKKDES